MRSRFAALAVGVMGTIHERSRNLPGAANLAAGTVVVWLALAVCATAVVPGGSYLFVWPLLFNLPAFLWVCGDGASGNRQWHGLALLAFSALPAVGLLSPLIYLLFTIVGTTGFPAVVSVVALLTGLLAPQWEYAATRRPCLLPLSAAVVSAVCFVAGLLTAGTQPG